MTVCIAATVLSEYVVTICDRKVCMAGFSADYMMEKADPVHPSWTAMVSGEDITPAIPIWDLVREKLGFNVGLRGSPPPEEKTLKEVVDAFVNSYQQYRKQEITNRFLVSHSLTPERFLNEGKKLLGLSLFTQIWNQITQFEIKCNFLVAGFDKFKGAHIFGVDDPGTCSDFTSIGFWAIGSGQQQALSSMFFSAKDAGPNPQFEAILYDLCAAKFMAERAEGVGEATNILVHRFGQKPRYFDDNAIGQLRDIWEREGRPRTPRGIIPLVQGLTLHPLDIMQ